MLCTAKQGMLEIHRHSLVFQIEVNLKLVAVAERQQKELIFHHKRCSDY